MHPRRQPLPTQQPVEPLNVLEEIQPQEPQPLEPEVEPLPQEPQPLEPQLGPEAEQIPNAEQNVAAPNAEQAAVPKATLEGITNEMKTVSHSPITKKRLTTGHQSSSNRR